MAPPNSISFLGSDTVYRSSIGIGFSSKTVPLSRLPGWEPESWAYHGDDGHSFCCQNSGKHYGPPFTAGDVIGCGVNFRTGSAFFTKNGDHLGWFPPSLLRITSRLDSSLLLTQPKVPPSAR
jgi:SPRY domain